MRPQKPQGSLGGKTPGGHLDFHTAPELTDPPIIMVLNVHKNHKAYYGRVEEVEGGMEVGRGGGVLYTHRYTVTTRISDSSINMGSDESHFNISVGSDGQSLSLIHISEPTRRA